MTKAAFDSNIEIKVSFLNEQDKEECKRMKE